MQLYYFETPNPRKAVAVARYLDAPVEYVRVDLFQGEQRRDDFKAINPNGKVPTLCDGDRVVWESNAIMCYLAMREASDLWPAGDLQVEVIKWLCWDMAHFSRHANTFVWEHIIKPRMDGSEPDAAEIEHATGHLRQFGAVLDAHLSGHEYVVGDKLTVADFALSSTLPLQEPARIPLDGFPSIDRWRGLLENIPAWRKPFPDSPATAASPFVA